MRRNILIGGAVAAVVVAAGTAMAVNAAALSLASDTGVGNSADVLITPAPTPVPSSDDRYGTPSPSATVEPGDDSSPARKSPAGTGISGEHETETEHETVPPVQNVAPAPIPSPSETYGDDDHGSEHPDDD